MPKKSKIDIAPELEKYRGCYETIKAAGYVRHMDHSERQEIYQIIRTKLDTNYLTDLNCGGCVVEMVKYAFTLKDRLNEI